MFVVVVVVVVVFSTSSCPSGILENRPEQASEHDRFPSKQYITTFLLSSSKHKTFLPRAASKHFTDHFCYST